MGRRTVGSVALAVAFSFAAGACGGGGGEGGAGTASACILTDEEMADAMGGTFRVTRSGTAEAGLGEQCTYAGSYTVRGETSGRTGRILVTVISSEGVESMTAMRKNGESLDGIGDEATTDDLFGMNRILMRLDDVYYLVGFRNETGSNPKATTKRIVQAIEKKLGST